MLKHSAVLAAVVNAIYYCKVRDRWVHRRLQMPGCHVEHSPQATLQDVFAAQHCDFALCTTLTPESGSTCDAAEHHCTSCSRCAATRNSVWNSSSHHMIFQGFAFLVHMTLCLQQNNVDLNSSDSLYSYLPLAHIFDRVNEEWFLYIGGSIGYWQVSKHLDSLLAFPTVFPASASCAY